MSKIINFQEAIAKQQKIRYIITIGDDETSIYVAEELEPGVITIMITARTPEESESLRKESTAIVKQGQRIGCCRRNCEMTNKSEVEGAT